MPLPRAVPVTLTAAERTTLTKRARGAKTAHRDRLRAQIVLGAARGRDNARIAADLQITRPQVKRALSTRSGGCRSGSSGERAMPVAGSRASGSSGGRLRRWRG